MLYLKLKTDNEKEFTEPLASPNHSKIAFDKRCRKFKPEESRFDVSYGNAKAYG